MTILQLHREQVPEVLSHLEVPEFPAHPLVQYLLDVLSHQGDLRSLLDPT